jgi:tRNA A-37 threonylcarbamoyl transferase component Bud32
VRTRCPHCGAEAEVPADATQAVCESCRRAFTLLARSETVTEPGGAPERGAGPGPTGTPTISQPKLRVNCPNCNAEFTIPVDEPNARCPRCDAPYSPPEGDEDTRPTGPSVRTARTVVTGRRSRPRPGAADEASLRWMQTQFEDRYEILSFVSRGGMGAVYRARQKQPTREVALKVMLAGTFTSPTQRKRFEREAQSVAGLKHPAIVPVYEYGEVAGQPYFTMEFVDGTNLRTHVQENQLKREQVCRLMVRVCDAIHYAHQRGVIHRDLKPGNIMVDELGRPRLLDFGLSRMSVQGEDEFSVLTMTGEFMGTPHYMSPEQALGRPRDVDERADVYALGIVLYELIVGVLPYPLQHARGLQLLDLIRSARPISPTALHSDIPRDLEIIMLKAIEKDKERRYESAEALARDLEAFLAGRPISARPATTTYRLNRWAWRNRKVLVPLGAALLLTAVITAFFLGRIGRLAREKGELEAMRQTYEKYDWYDEGAAAGVERFVEQGRWEDAYDLARFAPRIFPREAGLEYLAPKVRRRAELTVRRELQGLGALLDAGDYEAARRKATALGELAAEMPLAELRKRLAAAPRGFEERCHEAARRNATRALTRQQALDAVDGYLQYLPNGPHAEEARALRAELEAEPAPAFLERHREAFERAMRALDWSGAEEVIASAQQMLAGLESADATRWPGALAEMRRRLGGVIRPGTAGRLEMRTVLPTPESEGMRFVQGLAFAPDGSALASGAENGLLTVRQLPSGEERWSVALGSPVRCLAFSPDGRLLAAGLGEMGEGSVQVLSAADGEVVERHEEPERRVGSVGFSPDGGLLMAADLEAVRLWQVGSGRPVEPEGPLGRRPAALSPDGWRLAAYQDDGPVVVWDLEGGYETAQLDCPGLPLELAFGPGGALLAAICEEPPNKQLKVLRLWQTEPREPAARTPMGERRPMSLAFSPDGSLIAAGSLDRTVRLFTTAPLRELRRLAGHAHAVSSLAFSPDCRLLASGGHDSQVLLWGVAPEADSADAAPALE